MKRKRGDRLLLQDIVDAVAEAKNYFPSDRKQFDENPPLQSHLYLQVVIIGEAASRLSKALKQNNPQVPWKRVEGMRHVLIHDYFKIDWDILYGTLRDDLSPLGTQIQAILAATAPGDELFP
jgi:uncharacterized protein with HEPN domain